MKGTTKIGAEFNVGLSLLKFKYYLMLTHEPSLNTFTWTLDYRYSSDFGEALSLQLPLRRLDNFIVGRRRHHWALAGHAAPLQRVSCLPFSSSLAVTTDQCVRSSVRSGWSRILYSTQVKLFPWIPEFVVSFLTKTALIEVCRCTAFAECDTAHCAQSTTWVRKEAERVARDGAVSAEGGRRVALPDLAPCFLSDGEGSRYDTHCSQGGEAQRGQEL